MPPTKIGVTDSSQISLKDELASLGSIYLRLIRLIIPIRTIIKSSFGALDARAEIPAALDLLMVKGLFNIIDTERK